MPYPQLYNYLIMTGCYSQMLSLEAIASVRLQPYFGSPSKLMEVLTFNELSRLKVS